MMSRWAALAVSWSVVVRAVNVQENYTICNWGRLRAGVIRDTLYLDGGELWWQTAFADGTTPVTSSDGNVNGDMYLLNFSTPFNTATSNLSALLTPLSKANGAANNIAPNYIDGTIFANNDELFLYGGLPLLTNATSPQPGNNVLGYEAYQYGPDRSSWSPGFLSEDLTGGVTRYITNGAGVNVPSENLGFYFSGMRSPDWGPIYYQDSSASATANTLIEVDMSTMRSETWTNTTLPDNIVPRGNAELVWVPVSKQGVLVAIGGVTQPEELYPAGLNQTQTSESQSQSPGLMTSLPVYDIASQSWYTQNTTGTAPGQLTEFCSVVATANDSSSYNVYIYGGYDGLNAEDGPSDDVWILSIPSFTWIHAYSGISDHGRSGHRCVSPYPDQMFVVGGLHVDQTQCVGGGIIQVFNLNTLEFQDTYNPQQWSTYQVPSKVSSVIGGNAQGGSTKTAAWSDPSLSSVFSTKYTGNITSYYPYHYNGTISDPSSTSSGGSHTNKALVIALPIVAGLVLISLIILIILFCRRRSILKSSSGSATSAESRRRHRITRWLTGASPMHEGKGMHSAKGSSTSISPDMEDIAAVPFVGGAAALGTHDMTHRDSNQSSADTSNPSEMPAHEKPKPPFELPTTYNADGENSYGLPGHSGESSSGIHDYAYGQRNQQPVELSSSSSNYTSENPLSAQNSLKVRREHPDDVGQPAWPLAGGAAYRSHSYNSSNGSSNPTSFNPASDARFKYPAVPKVPDQYQGPTATGGLRPPMDSKTDSSSSGINTQPSPSGYQSGSSSENGGTMPSRVEELRHHGTTISPISPMTPTANDRMRRW